MTCDPTRIELSNLATTQVTFTVTPAPADLTNLVFSVPTLSISETVSLVSGTGSASIASVTADDYSIYDATIQIGSSAGATAEAVIVPTTNPSGIGVNVSGSDVTYCAPSGGGGVAGVSSIIAGTNITLGASGGTGDVTISAAGGSGSGTVTEVTGTAPISVTSGTTTPAITHADSGVLAGVTQYPRSVTVNATGHVTGLASGEEWSVKAGSTSIVTVGTIATGTWEATTIGTAYGGTGATSVPMVGLITAANAAAARTVLEVVNVGSYTGQIETVAAKTYTLDPAAATARTLSGLYMKLSTGTGSCTVTVKNGSSNVITSQSVTTSTGAFPISNNLAVLENDALAIEVIATIGSPTDLIFSLEYTE